MADKVRKSFTEKSQFSGIKKPAVKPVFTDYLFTPDYLMTFRLGLPRGFGGV